MKSSGFLLCIIAFIFLPGSAVAEYSEDTCRDLQRDISELEAKINRWEGLVYNKDTIMVQFVCKSGEYIVGCEVRCHERTKSDCIRVGGKVWAIMTKYHLQGHPRYGEFESKSQSRKDRIMGTRGGSSGMIPEWKKELQRLRQEYEENCGKSSGGSKFMGVDTDDLNWSESK